MVDFRAPMTKSPKFSQIRRLRRRHDRWCCLRLYFSHLAENGRARAQSSRWVNNDEQVPRQNLASMSKTQLPLSISPRIGDLRSICADLRVSAAYKSINSRVAPEVN